MALTASDIVKRAAMIIQDISHVRWPLTEKTDWLNDARRELAVVRPDIYIKTDDDFDLSAGNAEQAVPSDCLRVLDIPRNVDGTAISLTQRGFLDQQNPEWGKSTNKNNTIKHFMLDERDKEHFWVYPPAGDTAKVVIKYQTKPEEATVSGDTVSGDLNNFEEMYAGALVDYVCYRAFSKDAEYAGNAQRALAHYQQFQNALGVGHRNDLTYSPNLTNVGGVPSKQLATGG